jgi:hypothetical protein
MTNNSFSLETPESEGISSRAILRFFDYLEDKRIPIHSFLMMRHEHIICEAYWAPYTQCTLQRMYSITKSFVSLAIGILIHDGFLALTDRIIDFFPEKLPKYIPSQLQSTTIEHMLTMTTCHRMTTYKILNDTDWVKTFFTVEPDHDPGSLFLYDTSSAHVLCALVEKITGKSMMAFLKSKILDQLGFSKNAYILKDKQGIEMGGSGLMATSRDILSALHIFSHPSQPLKDFLIAACKKQIETNLTCFGNLPMLSHGYGYFVWKLPSSGFFLYGMGGQLAIYHPESDISLVTTAYTKAIEGGEQILFDALCALVTSCKNKPLTISHEYKELSERIKKLELIRINHSSQPFRVPQGGRFQFYPNSMGLLTVEMIYEETNIILTMHYTQATFHFVAGQEKNVFQPWVLDDENTMAVSYSIDANGTVSVFIQLLGTELGIITILFHQDGNRITMKIQQYRENGSPYFSGIASGSKVLTS